MTLTEPGRTAFLPFSTPDLGEEEAAEVRQSLLSGWLTTGPKVEKFTRDFLAYVNAPHGVALNSATAGLHIAQAAIGLKPFDEVITSPLTFTATANTTLHVGAKPVFCDIDPDTYNMDPVRLAEAAGPNTKAVIPVHFAGLPCDLDQISAVARKYGAVVIEDAAHAVGAEYKGRKLGALSEMTVFSFHPNKNMTTGEGGLVSFADGKYLKPLAILGFHGIDKTSWTGYPDRVVQDYDVVEAGFKYNMLDLQAAIGIHQLKKLDRFNARRAAIAAYYKRELADVEELHIPRLPAYAHKHAWHLFCPLVKTEKLDITRADFMNELKALNIGTGLHYRAIHEHPLYRRLGFRQGMFPKAEYAGRRIVSLPLFPKMTDRDAEDVVKAVKCVLARHLNK
ncbi:MAG: DegT/DnrJ/EryC1/StrS family aminotransferase [Elusimicrobiaceae bacterium]|nr:DegT/DnrJ/EryC1/StrS family aminotransferase [Elusimicrobiaceae bacterium]